MDTMNRLAVCAALALSLIATASAQPTNPKPGAYKIEEIRLGPMDYEKLNTLVGFPFSWGPTGSYVIPKGQKQYVLMGGKTGAEYDEIHFLTVSPDGKHVAYTAKKGGECLVVLDAEEYEGIYALIFRPDSKRLAYQAKRGEKRLVVVDGQAGAEYDQAYGLMFSPDGKHVAYRASNGMKQFVVLDGKPGVEYDGIGINGPTFNAQGVLEYQAFKHNTLYRVKHIPVP